MSNFTMSVAVFTTQLTFALVIASICVCVAIWSEIHDAISGSVQK